MNVAIDGPAGAGKSTIARAAAKKLGFISIRVRCTVRSVCIPCGMGWTPKIPKR